MSEEKLYAVKNEDGKYLLDSSLSMNYPEWTNDLDNTEIFVDKNNTVTASNSSGGHVVTFVEKPKKVALTKEQARIVEDARKDRLPASNISGNTSNSDGVEKLLMNAYVNGYTVAKEKKYLVYKELGSKQKNKQVAQAIKLDKGWITWIILKKEHLKTGASAQFTKKEIKQWGLQDCEKEEVTDDGIR